MVFLKAHLSSPLVPSVSPSGVRVERLNSTAMNVSWTLLTLEEARGFVTSYTVSYRKDEGMAKRTTESVVVPGGEQSSVVIGGLDPGSSYQVSVSASTSAGTGDMSEPVVLVEAEEPTNIGMPKFTVVILALLYFIYCFAYSAVCYHCFYWHTTDHWNIVCGVFSTNVSVYNYTFKR